MGVKEGQMWEGHIGHESRWLSGCKTRSTVGVDGCGCESRSGVNVAQWV